MLILLIAIKELQRVNPLSWRVNSTALPCVMFVFNVNLMLPACCHRLLVNVVFCYKKQTTFSDADKKSFHIISSVIFSIWRYISLSVLCTIIDRARCVTGYLHVVTDCNNWLQSVNATKQWFRNVMRVSTFEITLLWAVTDIF